MSIRMLFRGPECIPLRWLRDTPSTHRRRLRPSVSGHRSPRLRLPGVENLAGVRRQLALAPWLALILSCLLFAAGHLYQGLTGLIIALVQGVYFGMLFLKLGNLHALAIAHALYNLTVLILTLYADILPLPGTFGMF